MGAIFFNADFANETQTVQKECTVGEVGGNRFFVHELNEFIEIFLGGFFKFFPLSFFLCFTPATGTLHSPLHTPHFFQDFHNNNIIIIDISSKGTAKLARPIVPWGVADVITCGLSRVFSRNAKTKARSGF